MGHQSLALERQLMAAVQLPIRYRRHPIRFLLLEQSLGWLAVRQVQALRAPLRQRLAQELGLRPA